MQLDLGFKFLMKSLLPQLKTLAFVYVSDTLNFRCMSRPGVHFAPLRLTCPASLTQMVFTDPQGAIIDQAETGKGVIDAVAPMTGEYKACFANPAMGAVKTVDFVMHEADDVLQALAGEKEHKRLARSVTTLADALTEITDNVNHFWARDRKARNTAESTNSRVLWWSMAEMLAVAGTMGYVVWSIKTLFDSRAYA